MSLSDKIMRFSTRYDLFLVCSALINVMGDKILFLPAMIRSSHKLALAAWADRLHAHNHTIYWWSPAPITDSYQPQPGANMHIYHFKTSLEPEDYNQELLDGFEFLNSTALDEVMWTMEQSLPFRQSTVFKFVSPYCNSIFKRDSGSWSALSGMKFDLIILDELFNACGYALASIAKLRHKTPIAVYVSTCRQTRQTMTTNGIQIPYSYVPHMGNLLLIDDHMSFLQRLKSFIYHCIGEIGDSLNYKGTKALTVDRYLPEIRHVDFEYGVVSPIFQFYCLSKFLDLPMPLAPNHAHIGGLQMYYHSKRTSEPAPIDSALNTLINHYSNGFIIVAMGHITSFNKAKREISDAFIEALSQVSINLNMLVIWRYIGPDIRSKLPANVKVMKWVPQNQLLTHPRCKLLVTHGGCNSVTESIWNGIPMIVIPLFAEQGDTAARVRSRVLGEVVLKNNLSTKSLRDAMMRILTIEKYAINAQRFSKLFRDAGYPLGQSPADRAVFWTEFIVRHSDVFMNKSKFSFLRIPEFVRQNSIFKIFCFDVFIVLSMFLCAFSYLFFVIVTAAWRLISK